MAVANSDTVDVADPMGFDAEGDDASIYINDDPAPQTEDDEHPEGEQDGDGPEAEPRAGKSDAERLKTERAAKRKATKERDAANRRVMAMAEQFEQRFAQQEAISQELISRLQAYETGGVQQAQEAAEHAFQLASAVYQEALTSGDVARIVTADSARLDARDRLMQSKHMQPRAITVPQRQRQATNTPQVAPVATHATNFMARHPWLRISMTPQGPVALDADAAAILELDSHLITTEHTDPNSQEHWDELEQLAKARLPHRFKAASATGTQQRRGTGFSPVAGASRAPAGAGAGKVQLPNELIQAYRAMGRDVNDPKVRERMEKYYSESKGRRT